MALNNVVIMGRITNELEVKMTTSGRAVLSFAVALNRYSSGENPQTDYIDCVAWEKTAEFIKSYFSKGKMIALQGELRTRIYEDKNKSKRKVTEVYVNKVEFTGEKQETTNDEAGIGDLNDYTEITDAETPF